MSRILKPLFEDSAANAKVETEILKHCYVKTSASDTMDETINELLQDTVPVGLEGESFLNISQNERDDSDFNSQLKADMATVRPATYILTGGVGCGKTTFLKRYARFIAPGRVNRDFIWLHVDFLKYGDMGDEIKMGHVKEYVYEVIREQLETSYSSILPSNGVELRSVFRKHIDDIKMTLLHGIEEGSEKWNEIINEMMEQIQSNNSAYIGPILRKQGEEKQLVVIVLDNTDQLGEEFQQRVFLLSQQFTREYDAICIVSLREEKYFAAFRRGIFDAYGDHKYHIGSPELSEVLRRRLQRGYDNILQMHELETNHKQKNEWSDIVAIMTSFVQSITKHNADIVRMLACVSNGDMRYALEMFKEFISSGNTDMEKILRIINRGEEYRVPYHEFVKSAMLGSRRYYDSNKSKIMNIFQPSSATSSSNITSLQILGRMNTSVSCASRHGKGYVSTSKLLGEYRRVYGYADDFIATANELLRRGLLEAEPPRELNAKKTQALAITASGVYYYKYLATSFAYIDLVHMDTSITDDKLARRFAGMALKKNIDIRIKRTHLFLDLLHKEEDEEKSRLGVTSGSFTAREIPRIRKALLIEMDAIKQKLQNKYT